MEMENTEVENLEMMNESVLVENNYDRDIVKNQLKSRIMNDNIRPEQDFEELINNLRLKVKSLTEIVYYNTNIFIKREDNFLRLFGALYENVNITRVELVNVSMKDSDCIILMEALTTCISLEILNLESNELTNYGIELIGNMIENHPSLRELRIENQRMAVGIEAERALVNGLSQNKNITKLSYTFIDSFVAVLGDQYIRRNFDILRQIRNAQKVGNSDTVVFTPEPHPYPKREILIESKLNAQEKLKTIIDKMNSQTKSINEKPATKKIKKNMLLKQNIYVVVLKVQKKY